MKGNMCCANPCIWYRVHMGRIRHELVGISEGWFELISRNFRSLAIALLVLMIVRHVNNLCSQVKQGRVKLGLATISLKFCWCLVASGRVGCVYLLLDQLMSSQKNSSPCFL